MTIHGHSLHLHRRVQIFTLGLLSDQQGGFSEHWQPVFKMWMYIKPESSSFKASSGIERGLRRGTVNETTAIYQGWARHRPILLKGMRVVCSDRRTYVILDSPCEAGNYQSFHLGVSHPSDGGPR